MSDEGAEKQFKPSDRKLDQLKKDGTFLRAKEFNSGMSLIAGISLLVFLAHYYTGIMQRNFITAFSHLDEVAHSEEQAYAIYTQLAIDNFLIVFALGALIAAVIFSITFLLGGFGFSMRLLKFKGERISPAKNLKKILSAQNGIEVLKSVLKFGLFLGFFLSFLTREKNDLLNLISLHRPDRFHAAFEIICSFLISMIWPVLAISLFDMLYNYTTYHKKIKMSFQEVRDENKETDGNPDVKRRMKGAQRELLRRNLQSAVPQATVIITNPTHYAVALRYNESKDRAPKIMAKGIDHMAAEIRLLAIKNSIPIYEAPQLARAIYFTSKVGGAIHQDLYMAVAIVLSYVVQLKNYQRGLGQKPQVVEKLQIPESLHF